MNLLENRWLYYPALVVTALLLSTGPVCVTYQSADRVLGPTPLLLLVPLTLMTLTSFFVTRRFLIPRLLDSDRLKEFLILIILLSFSVEYAATWIDVAFCEIFSLPQRITNPGSPLVILFSLMACVFLALLLAGFAVWDLYGRHIAQEREETRLSAILDERIRRFRQRIPMQDIGHELNRAAILAEIDPSAANTIIRRISSSLRHSLYEEKPLRDEEDSAGAASSPSSPSIIEQLLTARRFRLQRHLGVLVFTAFCSVGVFFDRPDHIEVSAPYIATVVAFFLVMACTIYFSFYVIFPLFLKGGFARTVAWWLLFLPLFIVTLMCLNAIIENGPVNPLGVPQPWYVYPLGLLGTIISIFLQTVGCASIMLLRANIRGRWRLSRLRLETRQVEHQTLKSQVNPHFLFNVLNNAGILSYDDPAEAALILRELRHFLEYMLDDVERVDTSVGEEATLLKSYLTLERSSGRTLSTEFNCPPDLMDIRIPTLLLIPLVENAVKHSIGARKRSIAISFSKKHDHLVFTSSNPTPLPPPGSPLNSPLSTPDFLPLPSQPSTLNSRRPGGLGLYNIRRRLQLIYGNDASLSTMTTDGIFTARLSIPLN